MQQTHDDDDDDGDDDDDDDDECMHAYEILKIWDVTCSLRNCE